jgi:hypothetical protein
MGFKTAERKKLKSLIAMMGASGAGKTYSSLQVAYGLCGDWSKIGVADTEHSRAELYVNTDKHGMPIGEFQHLDITPPFTIDKFINAVEEAEKAGLEVLIIDSLSHAWAGMGGLLDQHNALGGRFQDWGKITPLQQKLIDKLVYADLHIIACMRTKQEYAMQKDELDKMEIKKLGTKPVQRDDFEYEFMTVFHLDDKHLAMTTKDNTGLFEEKGRFKIKVEDGQDLANWLDKGVDVRKQQEEERQAILGIIEGYRTGEFKAEIDALVTEFETKAKKPVTEFNLELVKRAVGLVEFKVNELQATKKEDKKKEKVAK